jgi:inner membrane transporter RhtA
VTPRSTHRVLAGVALVLVSCSAVEGSAALGSTIFDDLNPAAVAAWRQAFGALTLLAFLRPRLTGRGPSEWTFIAALGVAIATMNVAFYQAVDRVPLGIAATLLYLGPFAVAVTQTQLNWRLIAPMLALIGVALVSRPTGGATAVGIVAGLTAAGALAGYTLFSQRLGRDGGLDRLALAVTMSALILSPIAASSADSAGPSEWLVLLASGVFGVGLAFACDFVALKLAGARVVATLFALDPVIGALIGAGALSQNLAPLSVVGITLIVVAGAVTTATLGKTGPLVNIADAKRMPTERFEATPD